MTVAFFSILFFPLLRFSIKRFVCALASEGASSVVWSCSTEMSADLCYSVTDVGSESQSGTKKHFSWTPSHRSIPGLSTPAPIGPSILDGDSPPAPASM